MRNCMNGNHLIRFAPALMLALSPAGPGTLAREAHPAAPIVAPAAAATVRAPSRAADPPTRELHQGFDIGRYPGDAALATWKTAAPYEWVGYYLPSPCHRDASWQGRRETLQKQGWGVAVLYVGQQAFQGRPLRSRTSGPVHQCSRSHLTADRGVSDARDAIARARGDGFAPGTVVFLDIQPLRSVSPEMSAYFSAWTREVLREGTFLPGTYSITRNAPPLHALAVAEYRRAGRDDSPPFWISGSGPGEGDVPFARVWQGVRNRSRTWGGVTLRVDENVAHHPSPSHSLTL
jgi:hypothetical protein